ncbi:MAG: hypothetical protein JSU72_17455, partial [Deltaproteobacteria bacterium]
MMHHKSCTPLLWISILLVLTLLFINAGLAHADDCPERMTAYWKLDNAASQGIFEDSYNNIDGECSGNCPTQAPGKINDGQQFDRSAGTGIDAPGMYFNWGKNDSFSIEYWMKKDTACSGNEVIVGRKDGSNSLHWWTGCWGAGSAAFFLTDQDGGPSGELHGSTNMTDGSWHHIVVVRDGSANEHRLYVDGKSEDSQSMTFSAPFSGGEEVTLFSDSFDRPDNNMVGDGWTEAEDSNAEVGIRNNKLSFISTWDHVNRPMVTHSFAQVTHGKLAWEFDIDWARTGSEKSYRLFMQLGDGAMMTDASQDAGVGINLIWTRINGDHETLGYRHGGEVTPLTTLSGIAHVTVIADLDHHTYEVTVDGSVVQSQLPFDNLVNVDTVRFFPDGVGDINFSGRSFDNLQIKALLGSSAPVNIGWLNLKHGFHFDGTLDEVAVYNRVLSEAEIRNHYYLPRGYCDTCTAPVKIMPLGDSITVGRKSGVDPDDPAYYVSYRKNLWDSLSDAGYRVDFVGGESNGEAYANEGFDPDHEGHPGWTDNDMDDYVFGWLETSQPDIVLLHIGTNGLDEDPKNVNKILNEIDRYSEDITVLLARIINRENYVCPDDSETTTFNDNVEAMAQQRINAGDKIIIVDIECGAGIDYRQAPDGDMWDALHPYATGYTKMAAAWFDSLVGFLPVCTPPAQAAPSITSVPVTEAHVGQPYTYDVLATGYPPPTFALTLAPTGMTIDPDTGLIEWTPAAGQEGSHPIEVEALNSEGSDSQSFAVTVDAGNTVPTAQEQSVATTENTAIDITLSYTDPDGPGPYTFTIVQPPLHGTLSDHIDGDQLVVYTPDTAYTGSDNFTFMLNDGLDDSN